MPIHAHHIAPQAGGFEPQRTFDFALEIYGFPGAETLELALSSGFAPHSSSGITVIPWFGDNRKVAGRSNFPQGSINYRDYVDAPIASILEAWRLLVYDPVTGRVGLARDYKKEAAVILMDPAGGSLRAYSLAGVWPSALSSSALSYNAEGQREITVTLQYDWARFEG
jgi:hypothetical protein